ncbi:hypothetical protein, partial [Neorhizobium petrolearium]|uniref:hypothetical protein n=1 Tax=Neorhizobium petrolearium TaxID=515361 RepID=UPI003F13553E
MKQILEVNVGGCCIGLGTTTGFCTSDGASSFDCHRLDRDEKIKEIKPPMSNIEEFPLPSRKLSEYDALVAAAPSVLDAIPGAVYLC